MNKLLQQLGIGAKRTISQSPAPVNSPAPSSPPPGAFPFAPLYLYQNGRQVHFAPSPKYLLAFASGVNETALHGYLCFSHVPTPLTLWKNITLAEPDPPAYVSPPDQSALLANGQETAVATLRTLLKRATASRLEGIGEQEIGVFLSGGLDSSLIAALLVEAGAKVRAFTLDFGPPYNTELPYAQAVADHLRTPLHTVPAQPADIARALESTVQALPQPFGDAVTVPLYLLGKAASQHVQHVFNGEGGDQLFGGWANKPLMASLLYGDNFPEAEHREYMATYHRFWNLTDKLYTPEQRAKVGAVNEADWIAPALNRDAHPSLLHRLRFANLQLKGAQNIIPRMVALAHVHNLHLYAPLFDHDLTEWTFSLPPEWLLSGSCEKFLLKQVATAYLPNPIVWRTKRGMGVPTVAWLASGPVRRIADHYLSPRKLKSENRFNPAFVHPFLQGHDPTPEGAFRSRRAGEKAWTLLTWEIWRTLHKL